MKTATCTHVYCGGCFPESVFCPVCGKRLRDKCPQCGEMERIGQPYCSTEIREIRNRLEESVPERKYYEASEWHFYIFCLASMLLEYVFVVNVPEIRTFLRPLPESWFLVITLFFPLLLTVLMSIPYEIWAAKMRKENQRVRKQAQEDFWGQNPELAEKRQYVGDVV